MFAVGHLSEGWIKQLSGQCNRYTHGANSLFLTKDIQYTWFRPTGVCRFCSNIHLLGLCLSFVGFLSLSLRFWYRTRLPSDSLRCFSQSQVGEEGVFGRGDAGRRSLRSGRVECEIQVVLGV